MHLNTFQIQTQALFQLECISCPNTTVLPQGRSQPAHNADPISAPIADLPPALLQGTSRTTSSGSSDCQIPQQLNGSGRNSRDPFASVPELGPYVPLPSFGAYSQPEALQQLLNRDWILRQQEGGLSPSSTQPDRARESSKRASNASIPLSSRGPDLRDFSPQLHAEKRHSCCIESNQGSQGGFPEPGHQHVQTGSSRLASKSDAQHLIQVQSFDRRTHPVS